MKSDVDFTLVVHSVTITLTPEEARLIKQNTDLRMLPDEHSYIIHSQMAADLLRKIVELDI